MSFRNDDPPSPPDPNLLVAAAYKERNELYISISHILLSTCCPWGLRRNVFRLRLRAPRRRRNDGGFRSSHPTRHPTQPTLLNLCPENFFKNVLTTCVRGGNVESPYLSNTPTKRSLLRSSLTATPSLPCTVLCSTSSNWRRSRKTASSMIFSMLLTSTKWSFSYRRCSVRLS